MRFGIRIFFSYRFNWFGDFYEIIFNCFDLPAQVQSKLLTTHLPFWICTFDHVWLSIPSWLGNYQGCYFEPSRWFHSYFWPPFWGYGSVTRIPTIKIFLFLYHRINFHRNRWAPKFERECSPLLHKLILLILAYLWSILFSSTLSVNCNLNGKWKIY